MRRSVLFAAMLVAGPLWAQAPVDSPAVPAPIDMVCPIGGESFEHVRPAPVASLGLRADGKPYGGVHPAPLPECPGNGLIVYDEFDAGEIEKLTPIVASEAYQAQRGTETQYYRAYRLMRELGAESDLYLWVLLQATWEAEARPELRARYLAEFAEAAAAVPARPSDVRWLDMAGRGINALRELGRFDEAAAWLGKISLAPLQGAIPAATASQEELRVARSRQVLLEYFKVLSAAVARRDQALEPFAMIPRIVALGRCIDEAGKLGGEQRAFCESDATKADVERLRAQRGPAEFELDSLRRPRAESGR